MRLRSVTRLESLVRKYHRALQLFHHDFPDGVGALRRDRARQYGEKAGWPWSVSDVSLPAVYFAGKDFGRDRTNH